MRKFCEMNANLVYFEIYQGLPDMLKPPFQKYDLICVLGPTTSGNRYAVKLARELDGEIIFCRFAAIFRGWI